MPAISGKYILVNGALECGDAGPGELEERVWVHGGGGGKGGEEAK